MPLHSSIVDVLGVATVVLIIILCLAGVSCVSYVLYFRSQIRRGKLLALREFNAVWIVRIMLIVFAMLWGMLQLLRLPLLRQKGGPFYSWNFEQQATLCRVYTVSRLGFVEPCFFLTALFLVLGSVRDAPFTPRKKWNEKTIGFILLCSLPILLVQAFFGLINLRFAPSDSYTDERRVLGLPAYFTRSFIRGVHRQNEALCTYPLFSTLALGSFSCIYNCCFLWLGWRMVAVVINKRLQARVCCLVLALGMLPPLQVLLMGFSVLSTAGSPHFELLAFLDFLTVLLCISVGEGILVVQPIADALAVRWVFSSQSISLDQFAVPLCVFGTEEHLAPYPTPEQLSSKGTETLAGDKSVKLSSLISASVAVSMGPASEGDISGKLIKGSTAMP